MAAETETVRTHVVLPRRLVEEIDRLVGQRKRSEFIAGVLEDRLRAQRQLEAVEKSADILDPADYPQFATGEKISAWVHQLRQESEDSWNRKIGEGKP